MGMYEIDDLLQASVDLWSDAKDDDARWQRYVSGIQQLPDALALDAGVPHSKEAPDMAGDPPHIFELGHATMALAPSKGRPDLTYDWCAFLLNFWSHMPRSEAYESAAIQREWFGPMRLALSAIDVSAQEPKHPTLTLYPQGKDWFDDDHNALIQAFFSDLG